jgi:hypothetical protein
MQSARFHLTPRIALIMRVDDQCDDLVVWRQRSYFVLHSVSPTRFFAAVFTALLTIDHEAITRFTD